MSNTNDNVKDALIDVRRAYRLIYLYQDRLYSIIRYIQGSMNLNFYERASCYDNLGIKTTDFTSREVWHGIPLYNFCLALLPQSQNADKALENDWMLSLHFIADRDAFDETGWDFKDKDGKKITGEARPEQFVCVKESKSVLRIGIYRMDSDCKSPKNSDGERIWTNKWNENCNHEKEISLASLEDECGLNKMLDDFKQEAIKALKVDKDFFAN